MGGALRGADLIHSWPSGRERFLWEENAVMYFTLGGASSPACDPSLSAVEALIPLLESILRCSLQTRSQPYPTGKSGSPNWPRCPNWCCLVNTWSLVPMTQASSLYTLTWLELLPGPLWSRLLCTLVTPVLPPFHNFPAPSAFWFLGSLQNLFVSNSAILFQNPLLRSAPETMYSKDSSSSFLAQASTLVSSSMCPRA